jgi:hypothetical protein
MKTFSHLWQYLVKFLWERKMLWKTVDEKIETNSLCWIFFFFQKSPFMRQCRRMVEPGATYDVTTWDTRLVWWISKATRAHVPGHAHTYKFVIIIAFPRQQYSRMRLNVTLHVHCLYCFCQILYKSERVNKFQYETCTWNLIKSAAVVFELFRGNRQKDRWKRRYLCSHLATYLWMSPKIQGTETQRCQTVSFMSWTNVTKNYTWNKISRNNNTLHSSFFHSSFGVQVTAISQWES